MVIEKHELDYSLDTYSMLEQQADININEIDEAIHGKTYNEEFWLTRQLKKAFAFNRTTACPKESKVVYLKDAKTVYLLGKAIKVRGLVAVPHYIEGVVDHWKDGQVVRKKLTQKVNTHMMSKSAFMHPKAKKARYELCANCSIVKCDYNLNKEKR